MRTPRLPVSLLLSILFIASVILLPVLITGQSPPHVIYGEITDINSIPLQDARVFVNNTNTSESLSALSGTNGEYSVDISAYPSGYSVGHIINVTAVYDSYQTSGTVIVNTTPAQGLDLTLLLVSHIVEGRVLKPDYSPARLFTVNVTNQDTSKSGYCSTNSSGHYRIDISTYPSGYLTGQGLAVSCDFLGFYGSNTSVVSADNRQSIDIDLTDVEPPVISLWEAPIDVSLEDGFNIVARVTDNFKIDNVSLHIKEVGETLFTIYEMYQDDGGVYDWNSDFGPDLILYGRTIPPQLSIGTVYYYISATDGTFSPTLPGVDPELNPIEVNIIDDIPPEITHTPLTTIEAGYTIDLVTEATDFVSVDTVTLYLSEVGEAIFSPVEMLPNGNPDEYNATIPAQLPGELRYYITVNDTSDNSNRTPAAGSYEVDVVDTIPPAITHNPINSANVNDPINFTAEIVDIIGVNQVWINFTDVHDVEFNEPMLPLGGNMWYYLNESGQDSAIDGPLYYKIWANDTSGNLASHPSGTSSHAVDINDVGTPIINHVPVETNEVFQDINITAEVIDDAAITSVTLVYKEIGSPDYQMMDMPRIDGDAQQGNYSVNISSQGSLGIVGYYINATDGTNNITHPALKPCHNVSIVDTTAPTLNHTAISSTLVDTPISIEVNVSDNYQVGVVVLFYQAVNDKAWTQLPMSSSNSDSRGNGTYTANIPVQPSTGNLTYYFQANDTSGNNATMPDSLPKLNPYVIQIIDGNAPEIDFSPPAELNVNRSIRISVNVTDDLVVSNVAIHYNGTLASDFESVNLSKAGTNTYTGDIPAQLHSGTLQVYVSASDGVNINQTSIFNITVINNPPTITHTNRTFAPVMEGIDIIATIQDDVLVENVEFAWRIQGGASYTISEMDSALFTLYGIELAPFTELLTIEYHITAYDNETTTVWPAPGEDAELPISDIYPPVIVHQPIENLTTSQLPIIQADVTDNFDVVSVRVWFKNSTAEDYVSEALLPVSGNDTQFANVLGKQPAGEFSYYIEASDGTNTARLPEGTEFTVEVKGPSAGYWSIILLVILFVLLVIAFYLIFQRRKTIKR